MIGFYDYTVILTYISFASSISGIFLATRGHFNWAIFCLAFSGLCDMLDGKIARTKKNRTEDEKRFGIQIDSLCDVVCFGVFPIVLCYELGMTHFYSIPILIFYGLAGVIRLGYFNVMEEKRQNETSENRKYYQGLPITSMSVALPLLFVFAPLCRGYFLIWLHLLVLAVGVLPESLSALIVCYANSADEVRAFAKDDPYNHAGLITSFEVEPWMVAVGLPAIVKPQ